MKYETRIIAFLDILGFTGKVRNSQGNEEDIKAIYDALLDIKRLFLSDDSYKKFGTEITQFSDSLIISINENQNGGIYYMVSDCSFALHSLLSSGFLCRGVIHKGQLIHQDNICFGPAYLEALEIEGTEDRPVVKIKKELIEHARQFPGYAQIGFAEQEIKYILQHLKELSETFYYVNFFENYDTLVGAGNKATKEHYEKARAFIEGGLQNCTSYSAYKKYAWTRDKFNNSRIVKSYNIDSINHKMSRAKYLRMLPRTIKDNLMSWGKKRYLRK
jgi:hypothetical protein